MFEEIIIFSLEETTINGCLFFYPHYYDGYFPRPPSPKSPDFEARITGIILFTSSKSGGFASGVENINTKKRIHKIGGL